MVQPKVRTPRFSCWKIRTVLLLMLGVLLLELPPIVGGQGDHRAWGASDDAKHSPQPTWVVDPTDPGVDRPPAGRSLFDRLVSRQDAGHPTYDIPFPFSALLKKIAATVGSEEPSSLFEVLLIPIGRSLQRHAAAPDFFRFPRVLATVATDTETEKTSRTLYLKDRLFLAYQEKSAIIEVISYNEAAGRFEFQIVRNYQPGSSPEVLYANRKICTVCHQNHAPIFPDPLWNETNANPQIHARLQSEGSSFSSLPHGVDIASAFDAATKRANELLAVNKIWQEGCDSPAFSLKSVECRAHLLIRALQQRLSESSPLLPLASSRQDALLSPLQQGWKAQWPHGLWIPNPNIPDRLLTDFLPVIVRGFRRAVTDLRTDHGRGPFQPLRDPATPRPALTTWTFSPEADFSLLQLITGLSHFFSAADIHHLDRQLRSLGRQQQRPVMDFHSRCLTTIHPDSESGVHLTIRCNPVSTSEIERLQAFSLTGRISFDQGRFQTGTLSQLQIGHGEMHHNVTIHEASFREHATGEKLTLRLSHSPAGLRARTNEGDLIQSIDLTWGGSFPGAGPAQKRTVVSPATLSTRSDFSLVWKAVRRMQEDTLKGHTTALAHAPFRREILLATLSRYLGLAESIECCESQPDFPPVVLDAHSAHLNLSDRTDSRSTPFRLLDTYCGDCHHGGDPAPPNFLHGSIDQISHNLTQCAERIYIRLSMWDFAPAQRSLSPMPPATVLPRLTGEPDQWPQQPEAQLLKDYFLQLIKGRGKSPPVIADLTPRRYDELSQCVLSPNLMVSDTPSP